MSASLPLSVPLWHGKGRIYFLFDVMEVLRQGNVEECAGKLYRALWIASVAKVCEMAAKLDGEK